MHVWIMQSVAVRENNVLIEECHSIRKGDLSKNEKYHQILDYNTVWREAEGCKS